MRLEDFQSIVTSSRVNRSIHTIYLSISPTPHPLPGTSPMGVATAELSPGLPVQALSSCPLQPISPHSPLTHILFHPIFQSYKRPSPPIHTLNTTQIHFLNKFLISHPFNIYLSIYISDASSPPGNLPQGGGHGRVVSRSPCFKHCLSSFQTSPTCCLSPILFHSIYPLLRWSPPYSSSPSSALIHPLCKVTFIHSHHMPIPSQCAPLHPFNHSAVQSHC